MAPMLQLAAWFDVGGGDGWVPTGVVAVMVCGISVLGTAAMVLLNMRRQAGSAVGSRSCVYRPGVGRVEATVAVGGEATRGGEVTACCRC